jgi:uncharacterized protein (TIGR00645 family)
MKKLEKLIEDLIFLSRWIQLPVYLGLIIASVFYAIKFILQLKYLIVEFTAMTETTILLTILGLIDISMVINLLVVVFIGGYATFVSKISFEDHEDKPAWLSSINPSSLKIKLIIALVSISGVHLLKTFIDIHNVPLKDAALQIGIHLVFIVSVLLLAWADRIMHENTGKD